MTHRQTLTAALAALTFANCAASPPRAPDDFELDAPLMLRAPHVRAVHTVLPNDLALTYSPYNWAVTATSAASINGGAYFKTLVQSTFINLTFGVSNMAPTPSQLYVQVDNGPLVNVLIAPVVTVTIPTNNTHGDVPWHTLTVIIKSTTEGANRWQATGASTRVNFTGLVIDGDVTAWIPSTLNILIYGDSITEVREMIYLCIFMIVLQKAQHGNIPRIYSDDTRGFIFRNVFVYRLP